MGRRISGDQYGGTAKNDRAAVGAGVTHTGRGLTADQDDRGPEDDAIGRADTGGHVADARGGQAADQHSRCARPRDRPADVRYRRKTGRDPFRKPTITLDGTQARIEIPLNLKLSGSCTYQGRSGNCSGTLTGRSVAVVKVTTKPLKVDWL